MTQDQKATLAGVRRLAARTRKAQAAADAVRAERDQAIRDARLAGLTFREVADAAGMSLSLASRIVAR